MAEDKKIIWCFPELRIGDDHYDPNESYTTSFEEKVKILKTIRVLCLQISTCLYECLYDSSFQLPNTTALDFDLKDYYTNEYIKLGGSDQIAVVRLILDYPMFINLSDLDKRMYVLDKIVYAYQKLAELAGVATTELTNAAANIIETGFKRVITYKAKTSRNRAYQAGKMYIPYFGYRDWYIWVKDLKTYKIQEVFLFKEYNSYVQREIAYNIDIFEALEILKYSEKIHGWNKQNEFQISWGETHYFYNPQTATLRTESIKIEPQ
jgi:hypothetical protein